MTNSIMPTAPVHVIFKTPASPAAPEPYDWLDPMTRAVLAGQPTDRKGLILAALDLSDTFRNCGLVDAIVALLRLSATRSGISECDRIDEEVSKIVCAAYDYAAPWREKINVKQIPRELAHLLGPREERKLRSAARSAAVQDRADAEWGDD